MYFLDCINFFMQHFLSSWKIFLSRLLVFTILEIIFLNILFTLYLLIATINVNSALWLAQTLLNYGIYLGSALIWYYTDLVQYLYYLQLQAPNNAHDLQARIQTMEARKHPSS
jgi:hypothetical protein